MNRIPALLVRGRKSIRNFVKGSFGRLKLGANTGANTQDLLWTSLTALRTCSGAYPPLNGVVSALVAIFEISEAITHSKKEARELARHSVDLLKILAQAISDPAIISQPMLDSIASFEGTLTEIQSDMAQLVNRSIFWRLKHFNRTERKLRDIARRLDAASRVFAVGTAARTEASLHHVHVQLINPSAGPLTLCKKKYARDGHASSGVSSNVHKTSTGQNSSSSLSNSKELIVQGHFGDLAPHCLTFTM
ncbi:hypothetical protein C8R45DRAFT_1166652 [Mycena sanguinolenta]|nr:hypothetical protein C8R45DRAFT_1166652 [Mycena sanguinolenta]